ncbi:hypothetical protein KA005_45590 [bacterium]|nr:hypothetical protein [bacterium]
MEHENAMIYQTGGDNPNSYFLALIKSKRNGNENDKAPAKVHTKIIQTDLIALGLAEKNIKDKHEMANKTNDI